MASYSRTGSRTDRLSSNAQEAAKGLPTVFRKGPSLHRGAMDSPAVVSVSGATFTIAGWAHDRLGIRWRK